MDTNKLFGKVILIIFSIILSTGLISRSLSANDKINALADEIQTIVSSTGCDLSVQVTSAEKYDLLYEYNPKQKMIPASITKLITAATAISVLGVNYDFKTVIYTDDMNIADGIVDGNIYLKGYGDPDLNSSDISFLAKLVSARGVKTVTGNLIYDETYLDDQNYSVANYYKGDTRQNYWPYVSAINLDKNPGNFDPAASAAELLMQSLAAANVNVQGIVIAGVTPTAATEISRVAHTFADVITHMNKESDNHSAITIFKVIGAEYKSAPGSIENGEEAVVNFLTSMGNPRNIFEIVEGSGLSRYNTVNSDLYVRLLKYMYDDPNTFDYFYKSLAIAGTDGTLRNRMIGTEAERNVHAKTGTLNSVSSLSGYAISRDNELLIFYIAMNGFGGSANTERLRQDQICDALCRFSRN